MGEFPDASAHLVGGDDRAAEERQHDQRHGGKARGFLGLRGQALPIRGGAPQHPDRSAQLRGARGPQLHMAAGDVAFKLLGSAFCDQSALVELAAGGVLLLVVLALSWLTVAGNTCCSTVHLSSRGA